MKVLLSEILSIRFSNGPVIVLSDKSHLNIAPNAAPLVQKWLVRIITAVLEQHGTEAEEKTAPLERLHSFRRAALR